jgi:simple sugar transport system substrate-binding protein
VDVISFSPVVETGWEPVLREAQRAGIPVVLSDRAVDVSDESLYVSFIGSDFVKEGRLAAEWLVEKTGGKAVIAELQGTPGSAPAIDRKTGFEQVIAEHPEMKIVWSQSGNFTRVEGKKAFQAMLKSPLAQEVNVLFAHNDDMALGAIQAIKEAGLKPGEDILIVSVDAVKEALRALARGELNYSVECNPMIGPQLFDLIEDVAAGKEVPRRVIVEEGAFDQSVTQEVIDSRTY